MTFGYCLKAVRTGPYSPVRTGSGKDRFAHINHHLIRQEDDRQDVIRRYNYFSLFYSQHDCH